jgi:hypothetical protein
MTPKEKADELVYKYYKITKEFEFIKGEGLVPYYGSAKQCALIAADEIFYFIMNSENSTIYEIEYWQEVKTEIEKL